MMEKNNLKHTHAVMGHELDITALEKSAQHSVEVRKANRALRTAKKERENKRQNVM